MTCHVWLRTARLMMHSGAGWNENDHAHAFSSLSSIHWSLWFLDYPVFALQQNDGCSVSLQANYSCTILLLYSACTEMAAVFLSTVLSSARWNDFRTNRQDICKHLYVDALVGHVFAGLTFALVCWSRSRKDDSQGVLFDCGFPNSWGTWLSVQSCLPNVLRFQLPSEGSQRHCSDTQCGQ